MRGKERKECENRHHRSKAWWKIRDWPGVGGRYSAEASEGKEDVNHVIHRGAYGRRAEER